VGILLGGIVTFFTKKIQDDAKKKSAQNEADRILNKAKSEAIRLKKDSETKAKDFEGRARKNVELDINKQKSQLKNKESQLDRRLKEMDDQLKQKLDENEKFLRSLKDREEKIAIGEHRVKDLEKKADDDQRLLQKRLEIVATLTADEAKRHLLEALEEEAKLESVKRIAAIEEEAHKDADRRVKRILSVALSRFAAEYTTERTVSVMALPSDEMKGKDHWT
jgi:ribonuclease Y